MKEENIKMNTNTYDFSGWVTKANIRCSDGRTIMRDAFAHNDGQIVPLVWNHQHDGPDYVLGQVLLENRDEGVYGYGTFNDTEAGKTAKLLVQHGDVDALSIYANQLKESMSNVIHGNIREVSLVLAGANIGAHIEHVIAHGEESNEEAYIYTGEDITLSHSDFEAAEEDDYIEDFEEDDADEYTDDTEELEETYEIVDSDDSDDSDEDAEYDDTYEYEEEVDEMTEELMHADNADSEKTVRDVFDELTEEQKNVVYYMIGEALKAAEEDEEGDDSNMKHNVFEQDEVMGTYLTHADQENIINLAKTSGVGSLKTAMGIYAEQNSHLAHSFDDVDALFPDFTDVAPGAPGMIERDRDWVSVVLKKAHKSPAARVRTRHVDTRVADVEAKGYKEKGDQKAISGMVKVLKRTTDPQTVYYRDNLHRDDVLDLDFDAIAYQKTIMKRALEEEIALAALIGDGRDDAHADKISEDHIRSIWHDDEVYTIRATVDIEAARNELQGSDTAAHFGDNYIYAEAVITAAMYAREQYKGEGRPDFYCDPHLLNVMLLARDLNGRRIYDSKEDLAKVLNVGEIHEVERFAGRTREADDGKTMKILGIFVNMANYQFGSTKGGEITTFEDFDLDFNTYKYLMETRLSGALINPYSAIALEEVVTDVEG